MRYLVIERFHNGDPAPVYRRFHDRGRMAPAGLTYVGSWITEDLTTCYQIMECDERDLLGQWMANWSDIVDFEVLPVLTSAEVQERIGRRS